MEKRPSFRYLSNKSRLLVCLAAFAVAVAPLFSASAARPSGEPEAALVAREFGFALERSGDAGSTQMTLVLQPKSASGRMLTDRYATVVWIETPGGDLAGVEQLRLVTRIAEYRIDYSADGLPPRSIVRGRLVAPDGATLAEFSSPAS